MAARWGLANLISTYITIKYNIWELMGLLTFILMLIRKCFKRISRFFTGKCEIERAALANDHRLLGTPLK